MHRQVYRYRLFILFIASMWCISCSSTKKMSENEFYLNSNKFKFKGQKVFKSELSSYVLQEPNQKLFGFIPYRDWAYNQVPKKLDSVFFEYYNMSDNQRSQKLLDSLYERKNIPQYKGRSKWLSRQFYRLGAKPVRLDTAQSYASARNLKKFYFERGYFDAEVFPTFKIDSASKKARVIYNIDVKKPAEISEYNQSIQDKDLEKIYAKSMDGSVIREGNRFDVRNFETERDRLTQIFKNRGYYKFNELSNELIFRVDSTDDKKLRVTMKIAKPEGDEIKKFKKYYYGDVNIFANNTRGENINVSHQHYNLNYDKSFKIKPRVFTDAIAIKEGEVYTLKSIESTRKLIFDRENFSLSALELKESENPLDSTLIVNFHLRPKSKYDLELSFEGMYSEFINFGISPGLNLLIRNIFKGGENLNLNLRGTVGTVNNGAEDSHFFNAYELSFASELKFPRWLLPIDTENLIPKIYNPKSSIGIGLSGQRNIGLGSRSYLAYLRYEMTPNMSTHIFTPFEFEYIKNTEAEKYYKIFTTDNEIKNNTQQIYFHYKPAIEELFTSKKISQEGLERLMYIDDNFRKSLPQRDYTFDDYTDFRNMYLRKNNITQNVLIQTISHSYTYNENKETENENPWYVQMKGSFSGLYLRLLNTIFNLSKNKSFVGEDQFLIGGVPYSEFFRFDLDIRKTFQLKPKVQLALRNFMGIAIPYGNSDVIPFNRSYFAGGSNDIRAWQAYELSPEPFRPNDKGTYIDNMKITWNAELRFPISGILNGATFIDAGNIWSVNNESPRTAFHIDKFYKQLGVGAGFGTRFDFTFVIARLDFAYKIHDPAYPEGERWFRDFNLLNPQVQFGINYPF